MNHDKHPDNEINAALEEARRRVDATLGFLDVMCPQADRLTKRRLAHSILSLLHDKQRPIPPKRISPAALFEIFERHSQCVLNQTGRCPLLVFTEQMAEELNEFFRDEE